MSMANFDPSLRSFQRDDGGASGRGGGRFSRGWSLARDSWRFLRREPDLLLFPVFAGAATVAAAAIVLGPFLWYVRDHGGRWPYAVAIVGGSYLLNFIGIFFGVAFVAAVRQSLSGAGVSLGAAFASAGRRIGPIAGWALAATAVEVLLRALERVRGGVVVNVVVRWVLGAAWALATFFVVPVIAAEGVGPVEAARRSIAVIRTRWGESVSGSIYVGAIFLVGVVPALVLCAVGVALLGTVATVGFALIALGVLLVIAALAVQWALGLLFRYALYEYAANGEVIGPYAQADLDEAFQPTRGLLKRISRR